MNTNGLGECESAKIFGLMGLRVVMIAVRTVLSQH